MTKPSRLLFALALSATALFAQNSADSSQTRLLRFPATNGAEIVFSYAGQLYAVGMDGGTARRLTSAPGYVTFPRFSADGAQLAFTAQYDGNTEVFVMPADGGTPKRLTYTATLNRDDVSDRMGPNNIVMSWKNTTNEIAFRSRMRTFNDFIGQLYTVGLDAEVPSQIPVPRGGFVSYSPDDTKMAYNRVFREFRTWKRYVGGMSDEIWIFDFKTGAIENVSNNPAQDIMPMWAPNNKIYYVSERDGRFNLYSYDVATKKTAQHTTFKDFDIKFPSLGKGGIVFEQAGFLWHFDLKTEKARQVPVTVKEDAAGSRNSIVNVSKFVTDVAPSPDGKRAVVVARGEVFTVPAKNGAARNLTNTSGAHERDAAWSPDGKWIAYLSDETGENELWMRTQDGRGAAVQITKNADTYYYAPVWSPDSKKLLWSDRAQRLSFVDVDTKAVTLIETSDTFEITQYAWSPDSKWVGYIAPERNTYNKARLYSLADQKITDVTDGWYGVRAPSFSDDGKFFLFSSPRDFTPTYGNLEFNNVYLNQDRVYLVALAKGTDSPFKPKSDEVEIAKDEEKKDDKTPPDVKAGETKVAAAETPAAAPEKKDTAPATDKKDAKKKAVVVKVDLDGLKDRVIGLPIDPSNYARTAMVGDKVYYLRTSGGNTVGAPANATLMLYSLKDQKETELGAFDNFEITADGKKMLVGKGPDFGIIDLPTAKIDLKDKLNLAGLEMRLDRHAEWAQIYHESWRQMRDYFYAPNMHGVDWPAMRTKYAALLPAVQHRNDLTYVIGELISELSVGHAYVGGGERPEVPRIKLGLLGAELSRDTASRAYRIDRLLRGENWQNGTRSPLTEIGVDVTEGSYILAVNGRPVSGMANIYESLIGTAGKQVVLKVNTKPSDEGAREVTVVPIADESSLYYLAWVQKNIAYVSQKTGGKVGYIHIPDMGPNGLNEFMKHYYPQLGMKALIIDDRGNGGGNVSPQIAERLSRKLDFISVTRNGVPIANPGGTLLGPQVLLLNEFSASDGDIFPYRFRQRGLGKLIGKRSWGGVTGIRGTLPFVDGGTLNRPEFNNGYSNDGKAFVIEGHGVDPDIVVDNDPSREFKGEDQQLDKAIEVILEELKTKGYDMPPPPPWPVKKQP